ncbi:hypothetical protein BDN70DRAFT_898186 [Pholiota conissans]|uniref:Uncharacterized protein n=1 Tax=Pholiota conissans TaxID=109636 RepID=A0A9P5YTX1_9AGAR|nr:hypothetical protein BDN70DRAFT_898186 [Pholiota conissans]
MSTVSAAGLSGTSPPRDLILRLKKQIKDSDEDWRQKKRRALRNLLLDSPHPAQGPLEGHPRGGGPSKTGRRCTRPTTQELARSTRTPYCRDMPLMRKYGKTRLGFPISNYPWKNMDRKGPGWHFTPLGLCFWTFSCVEDFIGLLKVFSLALAVVHRQLPFSWIEARELTELGWEFSMTVFFVKKYQDQMASFHQNPVRMASAHCGFVWFLIADGNSLWLWLVSSGQLSKKVFIQVLRK